MGATLVKRQSSCCSVGKPSSAKRAMPALRSGNTHAGCSRASNRSNFSRYGSAAFVSFVCHRRVPSSCRVSLTSASESSSFSLPCVKGERKPKAGASLSRKLPSRLTAGCRQTGEAASGLRYNPLRQSAPPAGPAPASGRAGRAAPRAMQKLFGPTSPLRARRRSSSSSVSTTKPRPAPSISGRR